MSGHIMSVSHKWFLKSLSIQNCITWCNTFHQSHNNDINIHIILHLIPLPIPPANSCQILPNPAYSCLFLIIPAKLKSISNTTNRYSEITPYGEIIMYCIMYYIMWWNSLQSKAVANSFCQPVIIKCLWIEYTCSKKLNIIQWLVKRVYPKRWLQREN